MVGAPDTRAALVVLGLLAEGSQVKVLPLATVATKTSPKLAIDPRLTAPLTIIIYFLIPDIEPHLTASVIFSLILLALGLIPLQYKRIIDDTPTLKTIGTFIGQAELTGTAESKTPLTSYITGTKCVYYSWSITEPSTSGWTTVNSGKKYSTFYLKDDTGVIRIDPRNALLVPDTSLYVTVDHNDPLYYNKGLLTAANNPNLNRIVKETLIFKLGI